MIPKFSLLIAYHDDFKEQEKIGESSNGKTFQVIQSDTQIVFAKKLLNSNEADINNRLYHICDYLSKNKYPCYLPPSYITLADDQNNPASIYTKFMQCGSLQYIIEQQVQANSNINYDLTQEYLILYGISCFLQDFHSNKKVHGSLKLTNVLLDDQYKPYPTKESDIYSFGILVLQVLKHEVNIFSDYTDQVNQIEQLITANAKPTIPKEFPNQISELLNSCFSDDPKKRPSASDVKKTFEEILSEKNYEKRFNEFKASLLQEEEKITPEMAELKRKAEVGDLDSIFCYGKQLFLDQKEEEGMKYLRFASRNGYVPATNFYNNNRKDSSQNQEKMTNEDTYNEKNNNQFVHLKDDPYFEQESFNTTNIINDIKNNIDNVEISDFNEENLLHKNFILTKGAKERLTKLKKYVDAGVPVILEGLTGTSKTLSAVIICELTGRDLIRFNLSSETKSTDFLGRFVGNSDSLAGIEMIEGPFVDAFKNGKTLLLDEINLGSAECLKFIEGILDSGIISVEIQGKPLCEIKMHKEFRLIATQNPNKGLFIHKRQDLGNNFKSRFQVIKFPEFTKEELLNIAVGLAKKYNYQPENINQIINNLIDLHMSMIDDIQCFTVREIDATIKALSKDRNMYDTIMTIYGARFQKDKKDLLEKEFRKYKSFKYCKPGDFTYPDQFPKCFKNKSLSSALKSILFSFENHRHVILTGAEGSGLSQIARWVSHWYHQQHCNQSEKSSNKEYFCICTEETKCSDLIGKHKLSESLNTNNDNNSELIQWKNGFLTEAVMDGYLAVLDNIDEAPSTVTERTNGLLDQKYDEAPSTATERTNGLLDQKYDEENYNKDYMFEIPENPKQNKVPIHKNFRLLCTCKIDNLSQMSPAFINRFDVIVLENQIQDNEKDLKLLISMLMQQDKPSNFSPEQKVINLVYQKINLNQKEDTKITMFQLSQLCKAVTKYIDFFNQKINIESIVDFSFNMLNKNQDFEIPLNIQNYLLSKLKKQEDSNDSKFFFDRSPSLKSIIAKIYSASLINLPVCLLGPTGVGKTSAAREFSRIRPTKNQNNEPFLMQTFHAGTKSKDFYGTTTISNEQVLFINGTLTKAMVNGQTFIADEMNLSSISTMKSLAPTLEPISKQFLYIAGVEEPIKVNEEFFFIACQNELGTNGRNAIPRSIASRFRYFYYPKQEIEDISPICIQIAKSFYKDDETPSFSEKEAEKVGQYMLELNQLKQRIIPQWSLRDITKLFLRIHHQDTNKDEFRNMTLCKNIMFYTLAPVNKEDIDEIFESIIKLIGDIFSLSQSQKKELVDCYKSNPKIKEIDGQNFLLKSQSGILIHSFKNAKMFKTLPSLLNSMFQILLSDSSEPILLMGPSGFKTFLAQQFLIDAKIVTLNQESTVAQLLGSSAFLSNEEAKNFYIEYICKICHLYDQIPDFIQRYKNKKLSEDDLRNIVNPHVLGLPASFRYAINHLISKLFDYDQSNSNNCVLKNLELEFRPGLFLSAILESKSLILKDLSNLPTIILERFNELFSGKHSLTLNEDIHDTFTSKSEKELSEIGSQFRVFATCPPNSINKLSEAVLSRFTVICIPAYESLEQEIVLQSYIKLNDLSFNDSLITMLIKFSDKMNTILSKNFSFPQMINAVEMCSRLNKFSKPNGWIKNFGIILYRLGFGLLEKREKIKPKFLKIFDDLRIKLPNNLVSPTEENPLYITEDDTYQGVKSKMNEIFIKSTNTSKNNKQLAFTPMFSEMLDVLHLGISINIPVIFEGTSGQGKQTAINYISNMLGYQVINVIISQKTKVEDLFGKITITRDKKNNIKIHPIETKLVKVLNSDSETNNNNKSIIVFHNINNASSAVQEVLVSIFDQHQKDFLLPNGSTIKKGQVKIVGIFNPQNGIFNRDKLPSSLIYSSIYHIVNNPNDNEVLSIIQNQFENTQFGPNEAKSFYENFTITKKLSKEANASPLTLNDIVKYKKFRNETYGKFDSSIISLMLFAYRFLHHDTIANVIDKIGVIDMKFNPVFTYNSESNKLFIKVSKESKNEISLVFDPQKVDIDSIKSEIASLTLPEKRCILFLTFSLLSKQACLIKGETASGKSHIIRLFAQMLGKKLNVYQMNSETGVSILTGQSVLSNRLSDEDIKDINSALTDLERIPEISKYISDNIRNVTPDKWNRKIFSNLINFIQKGKFNNQPENLVIIESSKQIIIETIQPAKRFHIEESSFIRAMTEGEWVLFDGIESAPSEIIEKISSLCGDNPQLDLLECGEGYFFSLNNLPGSKPIHKNFHLFFTYNPTSLVENKTLDPDFANNCASFTLPSIDATPECSAQRILGSIIQYYPEKISVEISKRNAMQHMLAKNESIKDSDSFAGDLQLTGRTINNVTKEFLHHAKTCSNPVEKIFQPICYSMRYYYLNSYINAEKENDFKKRMIDEFGKKPDSKLFMNLTYEGINLKDKYKEILIDLRDLQINVTKDTKDNKYVFIYSGFTQKCLQLIQINDIDFIIDHINDTIDIINNNIHKDFAKEYSQLKIIANLLRDIKKEKKYLNDESSSMNLNDPDLQKTEKLNRPLSRLKLLEKLVLNNSNCFTPNIPYHLYNSDFISLMNSIVIMLKENSLDNFKAFITQLNLYPDFIPLIESLFPYNLFNDTSFKMINYILPMIRLLHESKTSFNIFVYDDKISFKYGEIKLFEPTYIFENDQNELTLSQASQIAFKLNIKADFKDKIPKDQFKNIESVNSFFFNLTKKFVDDIKNIKAFLTSKNNDYLVNNINPRKNQFSQLSSLLSPNKKHNSLIAQIWPIVYSFPKDTVKMFSKYLLPIEKDTLLAFEKVYKKIDSENIEQINNFSALMIDFGNENSYLWEIVNNKFYIDQNINYENAKNIMEKLVKEIKYLRNAPQLLSEKIWSPDHYIQLLEKEVDNVSEIVDKLIQKDENLKLKAKLKPILDQLEKITSKKNESLRDQILDEIRNDSRQNLTEAKITFYQNQVNKFIDSIKHDDNTYAKNAICWPTYKITTEISDYKSPMMELYQTIIWYSTIIDIFNNINDRNNQNIFQYILELNKFPEMQDIVKLLTNRFIHIENSNQKGLNKTDKVIINGIINANFISKLISSNSLNFISKLNKNFYSILNQLENREAIDDENILYWIHKIANQYLPNFNISLPDFQPSDFIYLFIGYNANNQEPRPGPLIFSIYDRNNKILIEKLQELLKSKNFDNFIQCSLEIAKIIYNIYTKKNLPNGINEIKNVLKECSKSNNKFRYALNIINIAESLDLHKGEKKAFTFNDVFFLEENWIKNEDYVNKYPSLVFWLCRNHLCADKLKSIYRNASFSEKKLPFWLFVLRLMSSESCITFDCQSTTPTATMLTQLINNEIQTRIRDKVSKSEYIGTKWLNILLPSPPSEISIPKYNTFYQMFYQFFLNLADDKKVLQRVTFEIKEKQINGFIKNVFDYTFNDDTEEIFDLPINSKDQIISLIRNPNDFITQNINRIMNDISRDFVQSQEMKNLASFTSQLKNNVNGQIKQLRVLIEKQDQDVERDINDKRLKFRKKELGEMKKNIFKSRNEYKKQFYSLLSHDPIYNLKEFQKKCNSLIQSCNFLPKCFDENAEPLELMKFEHKTRFSRPYHLCSIQINKNDTLDIYEKTPYYFYEEHLEGLMKLKHLSDKKDWTKIKIYPIDDKFDLNQYCNINYKESKQFPKPTLFMGLYYNSISQSQFISKIISVSNDTINFVQNLQEELQSIHINDDTFRIPNEIINTIDYLSKYFNAHYSDNNTKCDSVNSYLLQMKGTFDQLKKYISDLVYELRQKVEIMWKASYQNFALRPVFDNSYELPIPRFTQYMSSYNLFRNIKNTEFISNPILSIDNNSIVCCFKSINCTLGPFIPSLYSQQFALNFISFIDKSFTMEIKADSKYQDRFQPKYKFSKGDPVQIRFSLPEVSSNKKEDHKISTNIIFESENLNKLELQCTFLIKTVPLSFLISCMQSQLSFANDNFYVCKDRFLSSSLLTFSINNYYLDETNVLYQLVSLENNTIIKPMISKNGRNLELRIPEVKSIKRLHAELRLKFSNTFSTSILIDAVVIPFDFEFEVYDPNEKKYAKDVTVYYSPKCLKREMHFRILCLSLDEELEGKIQDNFPYEIKCKFARIRNRFLIKGNLEFDIDVTIDPNLKYKSYSSYYYVQRDPTYSLSINIKGINKSINLKFSQFTDQIKIYNRINTNLLSRFNGYAYDPSGKKWKSVHMNDDLVGYSYFVTPFSYSEANSCTVSYIMGCKVENTDDCFFVLINEDGEHIENPSTIAKIERKDSGVLRAFKQFFTNKNLDFYPIFGVAENCWFPVFEYDQYKSIQWKNLPFDESHIDQAKRDIEMLQNKYKYITNPNHFINLVKLLSNGKVIKRLNEFIQKLPVNIKVYFDEIIVKAETISDKDPLMNILSHNAILLFKDIFGTRFREIQDNKFRLVASSLSESDIKRQMMICYEEYSHVDKKSINYSLSSKYQTFKDMELEILDIKLEPKPEPKSDAFLYTEKSLPSPKKYGTKPEYITSYNSNISYKQTNDIKFELPKINIPTYSNKDSLTISELNDIYLSAVKGARLLPIFVSNMKSQNSASMTKEADNYFSTLLQLYNDLPVKDFSFISITTNLFKESFESMIRKFQKAGVDFTKKLNKHINSNENIQDFFQQPQKDEFTIPPDQWNAERKPEPVPRPNPIHSRHEFEIDPKHKENNKNQQKKPDPNNNINNKRKDNSTAISQNQQEENEQRNIELMNVISSLKKELKKIDNSEEDESEGKVVTENNEKDKKNGQLQNVLVVSGDTKDKQINSQKFDGMHSKFTEENGINRAISRMKNMKSDSVLNLVMPDPIEINPAFFNTTKDKLDFPINKLIPFGFYFANQFIKEASDMNIRKSKFAVNILVDCSSYISNENKIFNMLIICGLTTALESLEIPYSAAVIADKNFKCVIKKFEDPHSPKCLQQILDCLLIPRYRTKLASSIKYAIDTMAYPIDEKSKVNIRPYRAIFTFSDGLDEQLVLTKAWTDGILIDENISIGFIFIKSSKLAGDDLEIIENVWKTLETESYKAKSKLGIASIKAEISAELSDELSKLFRKVMNRSIIIETNETKKEMIAYSDASFTIEEKLTDINRFYGFISSDYHKIKEVYTNSTQVLRNASSTIDKLNVLKFRNKLKKIATCEIDDQLKKEDITDFIKRFLISKRKINQAPLEAIFKPNKASQTVLSTTGTDFDITALVLNLINPVPDPMIYLEEKGGLIRNYGISIVVDPSVSCFDELSGPHSFQTLQTLLSSLLTLDISCFDLIIAGNPQPTVICSEVGTIHSLSVKSTLFPSLLAILQNPIHGTDLSSAIHTAFDLRRMRSSERTSILFVLTDGLYENKECEKIVNSVNTCVQSGMTTFGIGIGNYPKGIEKLFPNVVFSLNPANVMKAIASFYGDPIPSLLEYMKPINFIPNTEELISTMKMLIDSEKTPIFNSLKDSLKNIFLTLDAIDDMYNEEQNIGDALKGYTNPVGSNTELYIKDLLKSQKILIVMLWDYTLNPDNEDHLIQQKYINEPSEIGAGCIKSAVDHYGIELTIVQNYEAAINELTKQTKPGYCDYYATWVFCGPPIEALPDKNADANLVGQFNEVLIKYWKNGGSIVFWAEGDPLNYQVNLFLEEADFEDECSSGKVSFHIGGSHKGTDTLFGEESDTLEKPKTFNRMKRINKKLQRSILSHNIVKIFEGISISYAPYDLDAIKPFKPFARDSEGGISSMFYEANSDKGTGDIIIDCGYSKCFTKMKTDGTFRYVQNIAGWTARPEVHKMIDHEEPNEWRPKAVEFTIQKGVIWPRFDLVQYNPKELRTLWAIDASISVKGDPFFHEELKKVVKEYHKPNDEFYLWSGDFEQIDYNGLQTFMNNKEARKPITRSSLIAQIANQSQIREHLLIVTDGGVTPEEIDLSDKYMKDFGIRFKFVTTFIIQYPYDLTTRQNLEDPNTRSQVSQSYLDEVELKPDLSVGAPYSRNCQNITYYINKTSSRIEMASLSSDDVNALNNIDKINSYNDFMNQYEKLEKAIKASTLGRVKNNDLINRLNLLKKRIINSGLDSQQLESFNEKFETLYKMANGELREALDPKKMAAILQGNIPKAD